MPLYFIVVFANIFKTGELQPDATVAKFATVVNRGIRGEVTEVESSVFWYLCAEDLRTCRVKLHIQYAGSVEVTMLPA